MADFQTLNCSWSSNMQGIWLKLFKASVTMDALLLLLKFVATESSVLILVNLPSSTSALLLSCDDIKYSSIAFQTYLN